MSRGEQNFINLPRFAAKMYDSMMQGKATRAYLREAAADLAPRINHGRLLDIGTGPGWLLLELNRLNPQIELFGLDVSESMLKQARKNLAGIKVELGQGNIRRSEYKNEFFDLATCTGSFYLWDQPAECLDEIYRILKPGCSAFLFESYRDFDEEKFQKALAGNLKKESLIRRLLSPIFLKKQLRMTYRTEEMEEIINRSAFAKNHHLERITLANLPIWVRMELRKS